MIVSTTMLKNNHTVFIYRTFISGEIIQQRADVYIGTDDDFNYNPVIQAQKHKHLEIHNIPTRYNNPSTIFCYSHRIFELANHIHKFQNKFTLLTHNSDQNIVDVAEIHRILDNPQLIEWYAQNVCFYHTKLKFHPIGMANSMWPHGDPNIFAQFSSDHVTWNKTKNTYFFFNIRTNPSTREPCYQALKNKLEWLGEVTPRENIQRLAEYRFCICPEGNGVDTHRLWEALFVGCTPVVLKSPFTDILMRNKVPILALDRWEDYVETTKS